MSSALRGHGTGGTDPCEQSRECWKSNTGLLQEQPMLLTIEQSLQSQWALSLYIVFPPKTMLVGGLIVSAYLFTNSQTHTVSRNLKLVDQMT